MRFAALLILAVLATPVATFAEQYVSNNGQVVHTRLAPVVAHKMVPPFAVSTRIKVVAAADNLASPARRLRLAFSPLEFDRPGIRSGANA